MLINRRRVSFLVAFIPNVLAICNLLNELLPVIGTVHGASGPDDHQT
jgi:hypothetical protein